MKLWPVVESLLRSCAVLEWLRTAQETVLTGLEGHLPEGHPDRLSAMSNLAATVKAQGDLARARELFEAVLRGCKRVLPEEHPRRLSAMSNLAATVYAQGDLDRARELEEAVLAARERILPEDHPDLLSAMGNLAATVKVQGDLPRARELEEAVLAARERILPEEHPDRLSAMSNLAGTVKAQGNLDRARELQEAVLASFERSLPEEHPDRLLAMGNLAGTVAVQGDLDRARELQEAVLAGFERILPEEHPHRLSAMGNLAVTVKAQGDLVRALELEEAVLTGFERVLPEDHPDRLSAMGNLAATVNVQGDLDRARELEEAVLAGRKRSLPEDHPDRLSAASNLAGTVAAQGDLDRARELEEAVLTAHERSLPDGHPDRLSAMGNLAATVKAQGDLGRARELEEAVLAARERSLPEEHPHRLSAMGNLAETVYCQGDLSRARELQEAVLAARERSLPEGHPDRLSAKGNLAKTVSAQGDLARARKLEEAVLAGRKRSLPEEHPHCLSAMLNLAVTVKAQGDLARARKLEEAVLAGFERTLPEDHPDRLVAMGNLAATVKAQGDLDRARELARALAMSLRQRLVSAQLSAPREARALLLSEAHRVSQLLFLSDSPESHQRTFELIETSRRMTDPSPRHARLVQEDPDLVALKAKLDLERGKLNVLSAGPIGQQSSENWKRDLHECVRRRDNFQSKILTRLDQAGLLVGPLEMKDLVARLNGAVAVSFFRYTRWELDDQRKVQGGRDCLLAHVLRPDGRLARVELGPVDHIAGPLMAWRRALGAPIDGEALNRRDHRDEEPLGAKLRELVLDPIVAELGGWDAVADLDRLVIITDDLLHLVPLDSLPIQDADGNWKRLFDLTAVQTETSFRRILGNEPALETDGGLVVVGGVHYDSKGASPRAGEEDVPLPYLPWTLNEAQQVQGLFEFLCKGATQLLDAAKATAEAVKSAVSGARVVHLATHGWFGFLDAAAFGSRSLSGPSLGEDHRHQARTFAPLSMCGLAFSGAGEPVQDGDTPSGRVTGEDLLSWPLEGCELAVLSACQTGAGIYEPGQGVQSLQAAVHGAGARSSLTSLWPVPDQRTSELMTLFCKGAWGQDEGKLEALSRTKQELRDRGWPAHAWAGWVLTGDPR
jgi:CHAT domain-containing protein